jgi:ATP-dependent RNA helicase DeaD
MTDEDLDVVREVEKVAPQGHAALADWSPAPEDNDDQPIFSEEGPAADEEEDEEIEIFVNVGRKDGVRPGDFVAVLAEAPGLNRDDIGRIRIRDKHTFILVRAEVIEDAVKALQGRSFGGRIANAERARPREE